MVNGRASHGRIRFLPRPSPSSLTAYVFFLFAFTLFIFMFYSRQVPDDDSNNSFTRQVSDDGSNDSFTPDDSQHQQVMEEKLWNAPFSKGFHPCVKLSNKYQAPQNWDRYITVRSNGGLNQMRTGISDMVAVARMMNASLVIPQLDKRSFWQDSSTFSDVFDEQHFITALQGDVRIVKELPKELESAPRARKHFTSWSSNSYYEEMTRLWSDYQVIHVPKSDSRLANNGLPLDIQRLRCRALYDALRFTPPIENLGKVLSIHDDDTTEAGGAVTGTWAIHCSSSEI